VQKLNISNVLSIRNLSSLGAGVCKFSVAGKIMYAIYYGDVALSVVALRATNTVIICSQQHIVYTYLIPQHLPSVILSDICYWLRLRESRMKAIVVARWRFSGARLEPKAGI
jgi:hypothetical protein